MRWHTEQILKVRLSNVISIPAASAPTQGRRKSPPRRPPTARNRLYSHVELGRQFDYLYEPQAPPPPPPPTPKAKPKPKPKDQDKRAAK